MAILSKQQLQNRYRPLLKNRRSNGTITITTTTTILTGIGMIGMGLFLWFWVIPTSTTTTTTSIPIKPPMTLQEERTLRSERVHPIKPRPSMTTFTTTNNNNNPITSSITLMNNNNTSSSIASSSSSCNYKSFSQLTEQEIQPIASTNRDNDRHMRTPPIGGKISLVCCDTTAGPLSIVVHSKWAPFGATRFLEMVTSGYMNDGIPLFRCVSKFLCQFGLSSNATKSKDFSDTFPDDPNWLPEGKDYRQNRLGVRRFSQGYLAYAGSGKHSRNKQLILALQSNGPLGGGSPWEVPWGEIVGSDSFETLSKIYTGYGENGPKQGRLMKEGVTDALRQEFPKLDYITHCALLDERVQEEPFVEPSSWV